LHVYKPSKIHVSPKNDMLLAFINERKEEKMENKEKKMKRR
jgi:hypothetical protein